MISSGSSSAGHLTRQKSHHFALGLLSTVAELNETELVTALGQGYSDLLGMPPVQRINYMKLPLNFSSAVEV